MNKSLASHVLQVVLLIVLGALFFGVFPWLSEQLSLRLKDLQGEFFTSLRQQTKRIWEYESLAPSIFQFLEFRNLKVTHEQSIDDVNVESLKFKVYYSLTNLLQEQGNPIDQIELENTRITLDEIKDQDFFRLVSELLTDSSQDFPKLKLSGRNVTLSYQGVGYVISGKNLHFSLDYNREALFFELRGDVEGSFPGFVDLPWFRTRLSIKGSLDRGLENAVVDISTEDLESPFFVLGPQSFQINKVGSHLDFVKTRDSRPFDLRASMDLTTQRLTAFLRTDNLVIGSVLKEIRSENSFFTPWLSTITTGLWGVDWNWASSELKYSYKGQLIIDNRLVPFPLDIQTDLSGNLQRMGIRFLNILTPQGGLYYSGSWNLQTGFPTGLVRAQKFRLPFSPHWTIHTLFRVDEVAKGLEIRSQNLEINELKFQNWQGGILNNGLELAFRLALEDNQLGRLFSSGTFLTTTNEVNMALSVEGLSVPLWYSSLVGPLSNEMLPWIEGSRLSLTSQVLFKNDQISSPKSLLQILWDQHPNRRLDLDFALTNQQFSLESAQLRWDGIMLQAQGDATLHKDLLSFQSNLSGLNSRLKLEGEYNLAKGNILLNGSYGLNVQGLLLPDQQDLKITMTDFPFVYQDIETKNSADLKFVQKTGQPWDIQILSWKTQVSNTGILKNFDLIAQGSISPNRIQLTTVSFQDLLSKVQGTMSAQWNQDLTQIDWSVDLSDFRQIETYRSQGYWNPTDSQFQIQFNHLPLERFNTYPFTGMTRGQFSYQGPHNQYRIQASGELYEGRFHTDPIQAKFTLTGNPSSLNIQDFQLGYLSHSLSQGRLDWNFNTGLVSMGAVYLGRWGATALRSRVTSEWNLREGFSIGSITNLDLERMTGRIHLTEIRQNSLPIDNILIQVSKVKDIISVRAGNPQFFQARITNSGFRMQLLSPFPLQLTAQGTLDKGVIDAQVTDIKLDFPSIKSLVENEAFSISAGQLSGGLKVMGPVNDPSFQGAITLKDLIAKPLFLRDPLGPVQAKLNISGNRIQIEPFLATSGSGQIRLEGNISVDHWGLDTYQFAAKIEELKPLPVDLSVGVLKAQGTATGTMNMVGDLFRGKLSGNLIVDDALLLLELVAPASSKSPSSYSLEIDLDIATGKRVEFVWPIPAYPRIRAFVTPSPGIRVQIPDLGGREYSVRGDVEIRGGEINWLNKTFYLKRGNLAFNENQDHFDPRLTLNGELRERDANGPVTVFLYVNDSLSKFSPRFESSPPKTQSEILAIVGYNFIAQGEAGQELVDTALNVAADVGTSFLLRPLEDTLKRNLGLDLLSIKTNILKNALTGSGEDGTISPQDYLDNTSLFLGKYLGENLFLEGNLSFTNTPVNEFGLNSSDGLTPSLELGLEMQTPFFLINWRFKPENPSQLFVTDNILSFQWTFNY